MRIVPTNRCRPVQAGRPTRVRTSAADTRPHGSIARSRILVGCTVLALATNGAAGAAAAAPPTTCNSANVVANALSAVVNISVLKVQNAQSAAVAAKPGPQFAVFVGSGAVIDPSGIIVTNKHVIQDAARIWVTFPNRAQVPAQLIAAASLMDLAVLQVTGLDALPSLRFANSDDLRIGQPVMAVGNPLGLGTSVSAGVVSGLNRDLMRTPFDDFIQTDASINPGNSGGPLLDCAGDIVGIDTALLSNSKLLGSIGLGFALPSNDASFVAEKLRHPETARPNWIGVNLQDLTFRLAAIFARPDMRGAIVTGVDPNGPAAHASLAAGDIVTGVDGNAMPDARAILRAVVAKPSGVPIGLSVWRHGQTAEVTLKGQPWPHMTALRSEILASPEAVARAEAEGPGLHVTSITDADRQRLRLGNIQGVLVDAVAPGSLAENVGLKVDDVIEQVSDQKAQSPAQVMDELRNGDPATHNMLALLVRNTTDTRWVTLDVGRFNVADLVAPPSPPASEGQARNAAAGPR